MVKRMAWLAILLLVSTGCVNGQVDAAEYDRAYEIINRHMTEAMEELGLPTPTPRIVYIEVPVTATPTPAGNPGPTSVTANDILSITGPDAAILPLSSGVTIGHVSQFDWIDASTLEGAVPELTIKNGIPIATLNGQIAMRAPDDDWWSPGDSYTDKPFFINIWVKPDFSQRCDFNLFGKYDITGKKQGSREWLIQFESCDSFISSIRDESTNYALKARWRGLPSPFGWHMITLVSDGIPSISGYHIYSNGVEVTNSDTVYGEYDAMENTDAPIVLGAMWKDGHPFQTFIGAIAGGPCGPLFGYGVLTPEKVGELYGVCVGIME